MTNFIAQYFQRRPFAFPFLYSTVLKEIEPKTVPVFESSNYLIAIEYNKALEKIPIAKRHEMQLGTTLFHNIEASLLIQMHDWYCKGKIIYNLSGGIIDLLAHTDVMDDAFDISLLPYNTFYIDISECKSFYSYHNDRKYVVVGCFISRISDCLELRVVYEPEDGYRSNWIVDTEFVKYVALEGFGEGTTIKSMLSKSIESEKGFNRETATKLEEMVDQLMGDPGFKEGPEIFVNPNSIQEKDEDRDEASAIASEILPLIFNAITYLISEKPDVVCKSTFSQGELHSKYNSGGRKIPQAQKVMNELTFLRQGKVKFMDVGRSYDTLIGGRQTGISREKSTHWRKGHFRNQAFGQNMLQKKIIWIQPTIVRKDRKDAFGGKEIRVD